MRIQRTAVPEKETRLLIETLADRRKPEVVKKKELETEVTRLCMMQVYNSVSFCRGYLGIQALIDVEVMYRRFWANPSISRCCNHASVCVMPCMQSLIYSNFGHSLLKVHSDYANC